MLLESNRRAVITTVGALFAGLLAASPALAVEASYIYGIHDPGGEGLMGNNKGWIVFTRAIGSNPNDFSGENFSNYSNAGYGVIVRMNNGYGSSGTLPVESQYGNWAQRAANYVAASSGVDYWIVANETNLPREWPGNVDGNPATGEPITSARYINAYNQTWTAVKNVAPSAKLMPAPNGVWAPPFPAQGIEEFDNYFVNVLNGISASRIDGVAIHAYTHGCDPSLVTSSQKMGPPYTDIHYHFRVYQDQMNRIPSSLNTRPVYITECDQNVECASGGNPQQTWLNQNNGWTKAIYGEINSWNQTHTQKIRCVAMFRWEQATEGQYTFSFQNLGGVHQDFQEAVAFGYTWGTGGGGCSTGPGTPSGTNLSPAAAFYIESGRNLTSQYGKAALDGSTSTKWTANVSQSGGSGSLMVDLGHTATVTGFVVRHAQSGGESSALNTQAFRVESGTSQFGPWTTEWTQDNACQASFNTFQFGSAKSLRYLRLVITDPGTDTWIRLPEFEIYGTPGTLAAVTVQAEDYQGGVNAAGGTDYNDTTTGNSGGQYRSQNVDIETSTDGRYNVGWTAGGEWLKYPIQGDGGLYFLSLRYATPSGSGSCHFELDDQPITGTLTFTNTGGWQNWATLNVGDVTLPTGWHTLEFVIDSAGFNVASYTLDPNGGGGGGGMIDGVPTGTNLSLSATQVAVSAQYDANNGGNKAIDGVVSAGSKWTSDGSAMPEWLKLDLGGNKTVNGFIVRHAGAGGEPTYYNTQAFSIQSGTSYTGPWTDETVVDNAAQANVTNRKYVTPKTLRYIRINITDAGIDNYVRLPEFEVVGVGGGGPLTVAEDFNSMPSWTSEFNAGWGSAASWSIVSGGQSGTALQATRSSQGSSAKAKVYNLTASTSYTVSVWIKCPSYGGSYWAECAYRLGSFSAQDFDENGSAWTMIKKFDNAGTNGNGNTWTQYSLNFSSGSNTQISVGFKSGSSGGGGPTVLWDTLRVQP